MKHSRRGSSKHWHEGGRFSGGGERISQFSIIPFLHPRREHEHHGNGYGKGVGEGKLRDDAEKRCFEKQENWHPRQQRAKNVSAIKLLKSTHNNFPSRKIMCGEGKFGAKLRPPVGTKGK